VSLSAPVDSTPQRFDLVLASFLQKPGLPFADVLPEETRRKEEEKGTHLVDAVGERQYEDALHAYDVEQAND
jgi:hypothetical protein